MKNRLLFIGSKEVGLYIFKRILSVISDSICGFVTISDESDSRSQLKNIEGICKEKEIELVVLSDTKKLRDCISRFSPQICLVVGWYSLISPDVLNMVPGGFIGIHNSFLPKYRGQAPLVWQMIKGEPKAGYSIFQLDAGMDEGDIWHQDEVAIEDDDYVSDVINKLSVSAGDYLESNIEDMVNGIIKPVPQRLEEISYATKRTPDDGNVDWKCTNREVYNFIRAQSKPYPGAFSFYKGKKLIIWKAREYSHRVVGIPGQIALIDKEKRMVVVACGNDTGLILEKVQVDEDEYEASDFFTSISWRFSDKEQPEMEMK